ncbi:MAG: alcohol dehydrogenase catalytic domain-containing protein [Chloroflexi bacterium]|nr:alcohol dehydrogenase catalytic domain-containing protein [Chloroflexota bacterium]
MKAWRLHDRGDFRLEEVALPEIRPGWVLVKVKVVQVAVVDRGYLEGMPHPHQARIARMLAEGKPVQVGHEYCGEVVEIGPGVATLNVGDRVTSAGGQIHCGTCSNCLAGRESQCVSPLHIGVEIPGAFAEYMSIPEWGMVTVPDGPTDNEVAALQPLGICVSDVRSASIKMGDTVAVLGQGAMGLGCLQVAKLAGAGLLVAADVRPEALDLSLDFGANAALNSAETDPVGEVRRLTEGLGADVVFEAAGGRKQDGLAGFQTLQQALQMVRRGGKVFQVANLEGLLELDPVFLCSRSIKYLFPDPVTAENLSYAAFLVASKRIKVSPQITHVLHGLDKLPEAMEITVNKAKFRTSNPPQIVVG